MCLSMSIRLVAKGANYEAGVAGSKPVRSVYYFYLAKLMCNLDLVMEVMN